MEIYRPGVDGIRTRNTGSPGFRSPLLKSTTDIRPQTDPPEPVKPLGTDPPQPGPAPAPVDPTIGQTPQQRAIARAAFGRDRLRSWGGSRAPAPMGREANGMIAYDPTFGNQFMAPGVQERGGANAPSLAQWRAQNARGYNPLKPAEPPPEPIPFLKSNTIPSKKQTNPGFY